jgi:hypothetical protein
MPQNDLTVSLPAADADRVTPGANSASPSAVEARGGSALPPLLTRDAVCAQIPPSALVAYLRATGWAQLDGNLGRDPLRCVLYGHPGLRHPWEFVTVPMRVDFGDYSRRVSEALDLIMKVEERWRVVAEAVFNPAPDLPANASLIAAAPELADALEAALANHRRFLPGSGGGLERETVQQIVVALRKAGRLPAEARP